MTPTAVRRKHVADGNWGKMGYLNTSLLDRWDEGSVSESWKDSGGTCQPVGPLDIL